MSEQWMDDALCAETDPDLFFPERGGSTVEAKKICQQCPVIEQCLAYALANEFDDGVWGGTSGYQRRQMRGWKRPGRRKLREREIEMLLEAGMSAHDIADAFGCTMAAMERWCERSGNLQWAWMFRKAS